MNSNRGPIIGLIIAIVVAVFALIQQQQAVNDLRVAATQAANAEADKVTAVAMMQDASGTQVIAEVGRATALAAVGQANAAQATAQAAAGTAMVQVQDAGTRSAELIATTSADSANAQATATTQAEALSTIQAEATAEVATLQGQLGGAATQQAQTDGLLGTATAQVDLAEFARQAAEDDRSNALSQLWAVSTSQAEISSALATAQVMLTGAPPTATPRPTLAATEADSTPPPLTPNSSGANAALPNTFKSTDEKIVVSYPDGWFAQEFRNGTIIVVNQEALFNRSEAALSAGQVEVDILVGTYEQYGITPGSTPTDMLGVIVDNIKSRQTNFQSSAVTAITIGSHSAAQVYATDGDNDISITAVQLSDTAITVVYGIAAKDEGSASIDTIIQIIASVDFIE